MISREEVIKLLDYDAATGAFTWKVARQGVKVGSEAGCIKVFGRSGSKKPYRHIGINGRYYLAHRLAWLVLTGGFPEDQIDHIDGCGLNNRSENLRAVTQKENGKNRRKHATNTSGAVGVSWHRSILKWIAYIKLNGKRKHLGYFDEFDDAVAVRKEAEKLYNFHPGHGMERPL